MLRLYCATFCLTILWLFIPNVAKADVADLTIETGCSTQPSYTASVNLQPAAYEVYAKLGRAGQADVVTGYGQGYGSDSLNRTCTTIGSSQVDGTNWSRLGTINVSKAEQVVIEIASPILQDIPDANRPSVLLVPSLSQLCVPTDECRVKIDSEEGYVRPISTKLNQDSLRLAIVSDPNNDTIKQVRYYVDDEHVYSSRTLDNFDLRYVAFGGQRLTRAVEYASGQQVILPGVSPSTHVDSFGNFVYRLSQRYPTAFSGAVVLIGAICIVSIMLGLLQAYRRRQAWRMHHGFIANKSGAIDMLVYRVIGWKGYSYIKYGFITIILVVGIGVLILAATRWGAQVVMVDGRSMETTYSTGDQVLVNKLPKTFADLNNGEYVPKRGEVVVVRANFGNVALDSSSYEASLIIKRVLALPGERVVVKDGVLTVYNKEFPEGFVPDKGSEWEKAMTPDEPTESIDIQLGTNELFLSGDNRPESIDSRFNGPLLTKEVVGVVAMNF